MMAGGVLQTFLKAIMDLKRGTSLRDELNLTDGGCVEGWQSCEHELKKREMKYKSGGQNGLHKGFVYDSTTFWHKVQDPPEAEIWRIVVMKATQSLEIV